MAGAARLAVTAAQKFCRKRLKRLDSDSGLASRLPPPLRDPARLRSASQDEVEEAARAARLGVAKSPLAPCNPLKRLKTRMGSTCQKLA